MNKEKLKGFMLLNGDKPEDLASALNIAVSSLSRKMNSYNDADFTQKEIAVIKERYKLNPQQVDEIFFADVVS